MNIKAPYEEREWICQTAAGSEDSFSRLFDFYRPNIYTTALRIIGDYTLAEEIVQDTFLKVWLKRETLPEIQNFVSWLYTVAQNYTFSALRKLKRERGHSGLLQMDPVIGSTTLNIIDEKEHARVLHQAIRRLPDKQRLTYHLMKEKGLRREEVAEILHVSPETVKTNLEMAIKRVRAFCLAHLDLSILFLLIKTV
jgi:RNA polymerase sigma-70 factor (ECF subfamily)